MTFLEILQGVEKKALRKMLEYNWPGNVRELENVLVHTAIHTQGEVLLEEFITPLLEESTANHSNRKAEHHTEQTLGDIERECIARALDQTHWHLGKTCEILGISRPTLRHKLRAYELSSSLKTT